MSNPIAALIERLNHHYWSVVLPFNPKTDTPRTDAELQQKLQLTITKMQETIFQMRLQREESKRKRQRTMVRLQYPPSEHTEDEFLRVISELAKLTKQSKDGVLANALNLYYRAVTLPAADLELLQSFIKDLEKKRGINWPATPPPP